MSELKSLLELKTESDPIYWIKENTNFEPYNYEAELLKDSEKKLRVVRKSRQIGITTTIAHEAVYKCATNDERLILIVSPSDRQSQIVMAKIHQIFNENENLQSRVLKQNLSEIVLENDSKILSLPNNPQRLRGFAATDIYLDEAAHFLNDEPVWAAIKPMLIATKGRLAIISTPFGKRGIFWDQYQFAVNQKGLDPTTKSYELYPSTISPLITDEDLEKEKQNMTEFEFKQEYFGEFIEEVDTYIPISLIEPCIDHNLQNKVSGDAFSTFFVGIDFAKRRDETVIYLIERQGDLVITSHIVAFAGMDYHNQLGRIKEISEKFMISGGLADQTGVGEAIIEDLKLIIPNVEGFLFTQQSKIELAANLRTLFEAQKIRIPNNKKLISQINSLRYEMSKTGNILFKSPEKETLHDDYLWALALACYSLRSVDSSRPMARSIR